MTARIPPTVGPPAPSSQERGELQHILDSHCPDLPKGVPVGYNLVVMQKGTEPFVLNAGRLPPDAVQHWGSVSKQFTAAAIARLIGHGVQWNDDIRKFLPELPVFKFNGAEQKITIDDLAHMRSGLPEMTTLAALAGKNDQTLPMNEKLELLKKWPGLLFKPHSEGMYCNTNYYLLAEIVARISHRSFPDFVREEVFSRLGMKCRCNVDPSCEETVEGYGPDSQIHTTQCQTWGATGVVGRPSDMIRWNEALDRGDWNDLLVEEPYARGLNIAHMGDYRVIYHGGAIDGFTTQFMRYEHRSDPRKTFAFFLTTNCDDIDGVQEISNQVAHALARKDGSLKIEGPPPEPSPVQIQKAEAERYEGTFETPLGLRYQVKAEHHKGTWVLHVELLGTPPRRLVTCVPTKNHLGETVFRGPIGDWLEMTPSGFILHGAKIAPFPFTKIKQAS